MKRTLTTVALAMALGLSLTACGGGNGKFDSLEEARRAVVKAGFPCEGANWTTNSDGKHGGCEDGPSISVFETEAELEGELREFEGTIAELDLSRPLLIRGKNWHMTPGIGNTDKLMAGLDGRIIGPDEPLVELE